MVLRVRKSFPYENTGPMKAFLMSKLKIGKLKYATRNT
jgi:hypothetical protein